MAKSSVILWRTQWQKYNTIQATKAEYSTKWKMLTYVSQWIAYTILNWFIECYSSGEPNKLVIYRFSHHISHTWVERVFRYSQLESDCTCILAKCVLFAVLTANKTGFSSLGSALIPLNSRLEISSQALCEKPHCLSALQLVCSTSVPPRSNMTECGWRVGLIVVSS